MGSVLKYKCNYCGELLNERERVDHAKRHHPGTSPANIKLFFLVRDFTQVKVEIKDIVNANSLYDDNGNLLNATQDDLEDSDTVNNDNNDKNNSESDNLIILGEYEEENEEEDQEENEDTQNYRPANILTTPPSYSEIGLFEYAVKRIANLFQKFPNILEPKAHNQWMNLCFDTRAYNAQTRTHYMSTIKNTFTEYFTNKKGQGRKYTFDFEKIARDYPKFFAFSARNYQEKTGLDAMIQALVTEIKLSSQWDKKDRYEVQRIVKVSRQKVNSTIYALHLKLDDSKDISFSEALSVTLKTSYNRYNCDCVDFDEDDSILYVTTPGTIIGNSGTLYVDTTFILEKILDRLRQVQSEGLKEDQPTKKFIEGNTSELLSFDEERNKEIEEIEDHDYYRIYNNYNNYDDFDSILERMDKYQSGAVKAVFDHDITFIWGPPGTGKSFTLANMINILGQKKESTLVCCISNVAVDQLLNKVIDSLNESDYLPYNCEFLRAGYTTDSRILATDYLFPRNYSIERLRSRIMDLNKSISEISKTKISDNQQIKYLTLVEERIKLREELKEAIDKIFNKSRVVFSTIAHYLLSVDLENKEFDNLIVDEASMLSMPILVALGRKVFKRIILVGDPNQLGPISISPNDWLSKSVFFHCKVLNQTHPHPGLKQLLIQRRSHKSIVNLINQYFYRGQLKAIVEKSPRWLRHCPFENKVIKVINPDSEENTARYIGTSRYNIGTRKKVMEILTQYYEFFIKTKANITIGVITPYRAQVRKYRNEIKDLYDKKDFWENIKVGTVHTFQGSECDIIIFDIVEKDLPVSRILYGKEGERLINVALSRARHQLIVVGDTQRFHGGSGLANVSHRTCRLLERLKDINAI